MIKNALALVAALAALAGCALSPPSAPTPAAPSPRLGGAISFAAPAADRAYYQPLIAAFEAAHPQARVVFVEADALGAGAGMPQGGLRVMARVADTGVGGVAPEDVASGTVLDLRPLLLADASFDRADYYPRALAPLAGDAAGGIYALPSTVAAPVLAADPLLADLAGVPLPPPDRPSTWAEVLAIAQAVAATSSPRRQVFGIMADDLGFAAFIGDVERRSPSVLGIPLRLGDASLAEALGAARVRAEAGITWQPEWMAGSPDQAAADLVAQHRLGMWDASYQSPALAQADARYFPAPETSFPAALPAQQGLFISAGTSSPQLAWRWLAFLSAQPPPEQARPGGGAVYARRSLNVQARVWDALPAQQAEAMRAALEQVPQRRATSAGEWAALHGAWEQAARRHIPPAQALADAAQALAAASAAPTAARQPPAVPSPAPAQPAQEIIRFGANEDEPRLRPLLRQFEHDHPSIKVAFTPLDVFEGDQAARMFATVARQQDCFSWPTPPPPALRSAVLDLQPLMAADAAFDAGDYPAALLGRVADHGRITALPFMLRLRAMGYNAVLAPDLDRAALSSFAGFADVARQYTATGGPTPRYGYAMRYGPPEDLAYVLGQAGASISRASPEGLQPDFLNPSAVRGIRTYIDLLRSASPYRALPGYHSGELQQGYITTGQSVFWTTFDVAGVTFGEVDPGVFEPHVLPLPRDAGRGSPDDMRISTLAIAKGSAHADACWQLLKTLGAAPSLISGGQFPARVSVAQSSAFRAQATPEALAVYASYRAALARPASSGVAGLFDDPAFDPYWLYEAVDAALAGDDLEQALERAQDTTAAYLACVRAGEDGGTCAARVDPAYQGIGPIGPR